LTRFKPTSPYGETKRVLERALSYYEQISALRSVSLRYFNAAGAAEGGSIGEDHDPAQFIILETVPAFQLWR